MKFLKGKFKIGDEVRVRPESPMFKNCQHFKYVVTAMEYRPDEVFSFENGSQGQVIWITAIQLPLPDDFDMRAELVFGEHELVATPDAGDLL